MAAPCRGFIRQLGPALAMRRVRKLPQPAASEGRRRGDGIATLPDSSNPPGVSPGPQIPELESVPGKCIPPGAQAKSDDVESIPEDDPDGIPFPYRPRRGGVRNRRGTRQGPYLHASSSETRGSPAGIDDDSWWEVKPRETFERERVAAGHLVREGFKWGRSDCGRQAADGGFDRCNLDRGLLRAVVASSQTKKKEHEHAIHSWRSRKELNSISAAKDNVEFRTLVRWGGLSHLLNGGAYRAYVHQMIVQEPEGVRAINHECPRAKTALGNRW